MARAARDLDSQGWSRSLFKRTVVPFLVLLCLATLFGFVARGLCPVASTVGDLLSGV
jgi:hypothetical protein